MGATLSSSKDEFIPDSSPHTDESGRPAEAGGERLAASARVDFTSLNIDRMWRRTMRRQSGVVSCLLAEGLCVGRQGQTLLLAAPLQKKVPRVFLHAVSLRLYRFPPGSSSLDPNVRV